MNKYKPSIYDDPDDTVQGRFPESNRFEMWRQNRNRNNNDRLPGIQQRESTADALLTGQQQRVPRDVINSASRSGRASATDRSRPSSPGSTRDDKAKLIGGAE
jgi:hypothetical protein